MKRFRFSLQALLTVRQRKEQEALEKYARAILLRQQALSALDGIHREQSDWRNRWNHEVIGGCPAEKLTQLRAWERRLTERRQEAEGLVRQAEIAVNHGLNEMLAARRDREAVEKHWNKQRLKYNVESNRSDQKVLDELAQRRGLLAAQSIGYWQTAYD